MLGGARTLAQRFNITPRQLTEAANVEELMGEAQAAPDGPPSAANPGPHGPHLRGQGETGEDAGDGPGNRGVAVEH